MPMDRNAKKPRLKVFTAVVLLMLVSLSVGTSYTPSAEAQQTTLGRPSEGTMPVPNLSPAGTDCSAPVVFDDQWSNGYRLVCQNHFYVLMVDLTNPAVKVEVRAIGTTGTQPLSGFADGNTIALLNADYRWDDLQTGTAGPQGLTISNGSNPNTYTNVWHFCHDALFRREIGFSQDGHVVIDWGYRFISDSQMRSWCSQYGVAMPGSGGGREGYSYNVVGGGPDFRYSGSFQWNCGYGYSGTSGASDCKNSGSDVIINDEHFGTSATNWWQQYQSTIGYSSDGTVLVLGESNLYTHTMRDAHDVMYQRLSAYGKSLEQALKFDSDTKAGFWYYDHTYDSTPNVTVPNAVRVERTNSTCYSLSTNVSPGGAGGVNINTSSNCAQGKYQPGTNVQMTANAGSGYSFSNWSGCDSTSGNTCNVTMNSNKNVTANFEANPVCYSLNTSVNPGGSGGITPDVSPNCNGNQYTSGTNVQLTASANSGYSFSSWSGCDSVSGVICNATMSSNKSVTANFTANPSTYTLTTGVTPAGSGSVSANPLPNDPLDGTKYTAGTVVTLTASANGGYAFSHWSGDASGSANPTTVTMNGDKNVTANFGSPTGVTLVVVPMSSTVGVGQTFTLTVQVQADTQAVDGAAAYLNFDPTKLQVVSVTPGSALPVNLANAFNNTTGQVDFAAGNLTPPHPSGTFTLASIAFQALDPTTSTAIAFNSILPRQSDATLGGASVLASTVNGTVSITTAVINGSVTVQGRPTPPDARWITGLRVSLTVPGETSPRYSFTPTTDNTGHFTLSGVTPGQYDLRVKNSHTLPNTLPNVAIVGGTNTLNLGTLLEGDANDDSYVTLLDFSVLAATFGKCQGTAGYDDRADFNEDQCVTLTDFSLLATNFGKGEQTVGQDAMLGSLPRSLPKTTQLTLVPSSVTVKPGQVFTVKVQVQAGTQAVDGAQASLDYDPAIMRVRRLTPGDKLPVGLLNRYDNGAGTIDFAAGTFSDFPSGSFTLVEIELEALQETVGTAIRFHAGSPRGSDVTYGGGSVLAQTIDGRIVVDSGVILYLPIITR